MRIEMPTVILLCLVAIPMFAQEASVESSDPQRIYDQRGCVTCHDRTKDQRMLGLGPSWRQISDAYKGNLDDLSKFLRGESKPKVQPTGNLEIDQAAHARMHEKVVSLRDLSESDRKALETFLFEHMLSH